MAANKRNKKYQPKGENPNPLSPYLTAIELVGLKRLGNTAILQMMQGKGTERHWCDLACRLIVGRKLIMTYFKEQDVAAQVHDNIARLIQIYNFEGTKRSGTWELPMIDVDRIRTSLEMIDDFLPQITRKEYGVVYMPISRIPINTLIDEDCSWEEYLKRQSVNKSDT